MKNTYYILLIIVLLSQLVNAKGSDPNEPNDIITDPNILAFLISDPNEPNDLTPDKHKHNTLPEDFHEAALEPMTIYKATDLPELKYRLLPVKCQLTEEDAADYYLKALKAVTDPNQYASGLIDHLLSTEKTNEDLQKLNSVIELLSTAGNCSNCSWDKFKKVKTPQLISNLKILTQILAKKASVQIENRNYKQAVDTIRTGLAFARNIAKGDTMIHGTQAVSTASIMLTQLEALVQSPQAPSLLRSLQDMRRPLVNLSPIMQKESRLLYDEYSHFIAVNRRGRYINSERYDEMMQNLAEQGALPPQVTSLMNRLDRFAAALECFEAIRFYTSKYGSLPQSLSDIDEFQLPIDPVTQSHFHYICKDGRAILKSTQSKKHPQPSAAIKYELIYKK